ncbi:MAG: hypothetical protein N3F07_00305 [Candidatus Micrarchaeota archaeon]|nr:hypothetical protein [Candidatus Micrarchaeota archaeon]
MAKKKKKAEAKAEPSGSMECCSHDRTKIEAGMLLIIGFVWFLQTFGFFAFGGEYFQMIGSILLIVVGVLKFIGKPCC